jgi:hypothetical protein
MATPASSFGSRAKAPALADSFLAEHFAEVGLPVACRSQLHETKRSIEDVKHTFALREKLPENEKAGVEVVHYRDVTGQLYKAVRALQIWERLEPNELARHNQPLVSNCIVFGPVGQPVRVLGIELPRIPSDAFKCGQCPSRSSYGCFAASCAGSLSSRLSLPDHDGSELSSGYVGRFGAGSHPIGSGTGKEDVRFICHSLARASRLRNACTCLTFNPTPPSSAKEACKVSIGIDRLIRARIRFPIPRKIGK